MDKLNFINNLILNSIKYVNNYSEFIGNSIFLNWSKYVNNPKKDRYLEKVLNNIDKLKKLEDKQFDEKFIQEIIISNLLYINKNRKECGSKYSNYMMSKIQMFNDLGFLLKFLVKEYVSIYEEINSDVVKPKPLNIVMPKKKKKIEEYYILDRDKNGNYYLHISFNNNIMSFDSKSFEYEMNVYRDRLKNNEDNPFFTDANLKYSVFEKKRRIYLKSMYDLDKYIRDLSSKYINVIYPVDKVFDCALEIVDNIYKEVVNYKDDKTILNNLMNKTIDNYGSVYKVVKYQKLVDMLLNKIFAADDEVKDILIMSANSIVVDKGYKEFRNIENIFPVKEDLYKAANEKISLYIKKNVKNIINNVSSLKLYTKYMNIDEIVSMYLELKEIMFDNRVKSNVFVELQKCVYLLLKEKYALDDSIIFDTYLKEIKMFK